MERHPGACNSSDAELVAVQRVTASEAWTSIRTSADQIGSPAGYDANHHSPDFGYGRINAERALGVAEAIARWHQ